MEAVEYRRRASIQEKGDTLWRAYPDRLEYYREDGVLRGVVPYDKVHKVRLAFTPGRFQQTRFLMELSGARSQVTLNNIHFNGIGRFEDRTDSFFPLVRAVVSGVHGTSPDAKFRAGERPAYYAFQLSFVLFALAFLALVLIALPVVLGNFVVSVLVKLAVIAVSLPLMFSWVVNARPRRFDPVSGLEGVLSAR